MNLSTVKIRSFSPGDEKIVSNLVRQANPMGNCGNASQKAQSTLNKSVN
jgi:hypothetical protein